MSSTIHSHSCVFLPFSSCRIVTPRRRAVCRHAVCRHASCRRATALTPANNAFPCEIFICILVFILYNLSLKQCCFPYHTIRRQLSGKINTSACWFIFFPQSSRAKKTLEIHLRSFYLYIGMSFVNAANNATVLICRDGSLSVSNVAIVCEFLTKRMEPENYRFSLRVHKRKLKFSSCLLYNPLFPSASRLVRRESACGADRRYEP